MLDSNTLRNIIKEIFNTVEQIPFFHIPKIRCTESFCLSE